MHRRAAANVPERQPGRGITSDGLHFAAALPRVDGLTSTADLAEGVRQLVDGIAGTGRPAPAVRLLPSALPHSQLPPPSADSVPIGIDESELTPVALDFAADSHLVVLGDTQSGKSNLLRLIAHAVMQAHSPRAGQANRDRLSTRAVRDGPRRPRHRLRRISYGGGTDRRRCRGSAAGTAARPRCLA